MASGSVKKTCIVCGTDCAHTPRVKDPRGRYYCKPCYEEALKHAKESAQTPEECPECDAPLEKGAVLCVNCGYVLKSGRHITPQVVDDDESGEAPAEDSEKLSRTGTKWPVVVGVISMIFAFFGAINYGISALGLLLIDPTAQGGPMLWALQLVANFVLFVLSGALGVLAIVLLQRRQLAAVWLPRWAWTKAGVSVVLVGVVGASVDVDSMIERGLPPELAGLGVAAILVVFFFILLWLLFWPVFLLLWLRRPKIREETARWK